MQNAVPTEDYLSRFMGDCFGEHATTKTYRKREQTDDHDAERRAEMRRDGSECLPSDDRIQNNVSLQ